jgi:hypothetical protein
MASLQHVCQSAEYAILHGACEPARVHTCSVTAVCGEKANICTQSLACDIIRVEQHKDVCVATCDKA